MIGPVVLVTDDPVTAGLARALLDSESRGQILREDEASGVAGTVVLVVCLTEDPLVHVAARRRRWPVVVLVPDPTPVDVLAAIDSGALGVVAASDVHVDELGAALQAARSGRPHLSAGAVAVLAQELARGRAAPPATPRAPTALTPRERQVMDAVVLGLDDHAVALRLGIGERTVAHHLESVYAKADVHSRAAASAWWNGSGPGGAGDEDRDGGGDNEPCPRGPDLPSVDVDRENPHQPGGPPCPAHRHT